MRRPFVLPLLALLATACAAFPTGGPPAPLPRTELARGAYGPCTASRREVVRDAARWTEVWAAIQPTRMAAPAVDFDGQMVVVACLGERRSGGHSIEIAEVAVGDDALTVTVRTHAPTAGAITTQALTQPYHAVRVARTALPVRWVEVAD